MPVPRLTHSALGAPVPLDVLAKRYRRIWLVVAPPFTDEMLGRTFAGLRGAATLAGRIRFAQSRASDAPVFPLVYLFATGATPSN